MELFNPQDEELYTPQEEDELFTPHNNPTDALTLLTAARSILQPSSSSTSDMRHVRISEATDPIAELMVTTSPMVNHLMAALSERATEQVIASVSPRIAWNTAVNNQSAWPLLGPNSLQAQATSSSDAPTTSPPIESVATGSMMRTPVASSDPSLIRAPTFPVFPSTSSSSSSLANYFSTMTSYHPLGEPRQVTAMHAQPASRARQPYSGYQRGQDWPHQRNTEGQWSPGAPFPFPHQESYSERENLPQPTQSSMIPADQRNLVNPPQKPFADQSRPSVIKSVKSKSPVDKINPLPVDPDKTALIIKYIHKKFSWKTLTSLDQQSNVPSDQLSCAPWDQPSFVPSQTNSLRSSVIVGSSPTPLSTEFNEIFKQEESGPELDNIGSSVDLEDLDLQLEGHSDIQAICLTYLAEDVPYMEERKNVFVNAWYEINMGEKLVANWIAFARDNVPLPRDFHVMAHNQLM